jgi:hypothetical protein
MKDISKLKQEQSELKERLHKLVDFINSEEYYSLDAQEKSLLASQRAGMEIYLNSLTQRIYGANDANFTGNMLPLLLMSMFNPCPLPGSISSKGIEGNDKPQ